MSNYTDRTDEYEKLESENRRLKEELEAAKLKTVIDADTGLLTPPAFLKAAEKKLRDAAPGEYVLACLEIGYFTELSERFGYNEADKLISYIGEATRHFTGEGEECIACRLGIKRFYRLLSSKSGTENADEAFDLYLKRFGLPFNIICYKGAYVINNTGLPIRQYIGYAVSAMRDAKKSGDSRVHLFSREQHECDLRRQYLVDNIDSALLNREFVPVFQPQIYIGKNGIRPFRAEVLCRWIKDGMTVADPDEFISVFEDSGQIGKLDQYMTHEACRFVREYIDETGNDDICISVNVSKRSLCSEDFVSTGIGIIRQYRIPFKCIEVEITESIAITEFDLLRSLLKTIREYGARVAIDDFGAKYSSLDVIQKLNFDALKMDRNFFTDNEDLHRRNMVIGNVVALSQDLNVEIIAEGIEDEATVEFLRVVGCDYVQGFVFSKPVVKEELRKWYNFSAAEENTELSDDVSSLRAYNAFYRRSNFSISAKEYDDLLRAAKIGAWTMECDEGKPVRTYINSVMEELIGVPHGNAPEDNHIKINEGIVPGYIDTVNNYLENIRRNGSDEVVYLWQYPDGRRMTIRCVGVLDKQYKGRGFRISGYHQDITQSALEETLEDERRSTRITQAFANRFYITYYINVKDNSYFEFKSTDYLRERIASKGKDARVSFELWINTILAPEFRDKVRAFVDLSTLEERLKADPDIYIDYISANGQWTRGSFIAVDYDTSGSLYHVIYTARIIEAEKRAELEAQRAAEEIKKTNIQLQEQMDIVGAMGQIAYNAYYIDIEHDSFKILKQQTPVNAIIHEDLGLVEMVGILLQTLDEESRNNMSKYIADAEKIRAFTKNRDTAVLEYRSILGVWNRAYLVVISRTERGEADRLLWLMIDMDDEKRREQEARHQLTLIERERDIDSQTGILGRDAVTRVIKDTISGIDGERFAFLIIDLDDLKYINDNYGHAQGDRAIKAIADTMRESFRENDTIGRYGGDEFVALLNRVPSAECLNVILDRFIDKVKANRAGENDEYPITCSVGVYTGKRGTESFDEVFNRADIALYNAKRSGKCSYCCYSDEMHK